jgi:hypothetical protein
MLKVSCVNSFPFTLPTGFELTSLNSTGVREGDADNASNAATAAATNKKITTTLRMYGNA